MHIAYIHSTYCGHGDTTEAALGHAELEQLFMDVGSDVWPLWVEGEVVSLERFE